MSIKQLLAKYVVGELKTNELPQFALEALSEGYDSYTLRILAGRAAKEYPSILEEDFNKVLEENRFPLPDKRTATLVLVSSIAEDILQNKRGLYEGLQEMFSALYHYDFRAEDKKYVYDSIYLSTLYGLLDQWEDLMISDYPWSTIKSNEVLISEIQTDTLEELKKWRKKIGV